MSDIINLGAERDRRDGPDPQFRKSDDFGRPMFCFMLDYQMDGAQWSLELWAYSLEDAEKRATAARESLTVAGQLYGELRP